MATTAAEANPADQRAAPAERKVYGWLDWLRAACALSVMLTHARYATFPPYAAVAHPSVGDWLFYAATSAGYASLPTFFVLSGVLVGGPAISKALAGGFCWRSYAADRVARIGLPLAAALVLTALVGLVARGNADWLRIAASALSLQGILIDRPDVNGPLWTLSYEVWFYVAGGALAAAIVKPRWTALAVLAVACAVLSALHLVWLFPWALGALASFWRPKPSVLHALGIAAAAALTIVFARPSSGWPMSDVGIVLASITSAWLICVLRASRCPRALARAGAICAAPTYTLYLCHYPLWFLFAAWGLEPRGSFPTFVAVAASWLGFAVVMYFPFERRCPELRLWLRRRWAPEAPMRA
jgi:peptidoglycan/LPS O-acetylase OafA/YrhL